MRLFAMLAFVFAALLGAEEAPTLLEARAVDNEIQKLPNLPETTRATAFRHMLQRVRKLDKQYQLALASNLAVSAGEVATDSSILQEIANLLMASLEGKLSSNAAELALTSLAEMSFYRHIQVSLDAPAYRAKLMRLEEHARTRSNTDFTLSDMSGTRWRLKSLGGKVVLVTFWATWCLPCQRELSEFRSVYSRFAKQGLVILAITGEDRTTVTQYLGDHPLTFSVLLDPGDRTKQQFLVTGIPHTVLYNRDGKMVAEIPGPPTEQQLAEALMQSGLK